LAFGESCEVNDDGLIVSKVFVSTRAIEIQPFKSVCVPRLSTLRQLNQENMGFRLSVVLGSHANMRCKSEDQYNEIPDNGIETAIGSL
jgi:hypothetical protein